jgi:hypothetical protein
MKRSLLLIFTLLLLIGCAPRRAQAQFLGYTSPQTVQQTLATAQACSGTSLFNATNIGQTQHTVTFTTAGNPVTAAVEIDGIDVLGINFRISDVLMGPGVVTGVGYFPKIQIKVTCAPGSATFNLAYAGVSSTPNPTAGLYVQSQLDKFIQQAANNNASALVSGVGTPFGNSFGQLVFIYNSSPLAGSTLTVTCFNTWTTTPFTQTFNVANISTVQVFPVTPEYCASLNVTYTTGGASAGTYNLSYEFFPPGIPLNSNQYTHVTTTTATAAKATPGFLHAVTVNTAAAGTISIFDLPTASCTGTPATNIVAVITVPAATNGLPPFLYDVNLLQGICVKASVAMDFTVSTN